ncbi:MAG: cyclophilin-like fold protein, partial [Sutterellaceae bacterium]|nr:cyclophilin-like fold protein [Sutterellaceae bacterium]
MSQTIEFVVDNQAYPAELNGNDAAKSLVSQLPITLEFENFGSLERIATPPKSLNLGSAPQE